MRSLDFGRYMLSSCVAVSLVTGCGGAPSPTLQSLPATSAIVPDAHHTPPPGFFKGERLRGRAQLYSISCTYPFTSEGYIAHGSATGPFPAPSPRTAPGANMIMASTSLFSLRQKGRFTSSLSSCTDTSDTVMFSLYTTRAQSTGSKYLGGISLRSSAKTSPLGLSPEN